MKDVGVVCPKRNIEYNKRPLFVYWVLVGDSLFFVLKEDGWMGGWSSREGELRLFQNAQSDGVVDWLVVGWWLVSWTNFFSLCSRRWVVDVEE